MRFPLTSGATAPAGDLYLLALNSNPFAAGLIFRAVQFYRRRGEGQRPGYRYRLG